MQDKIVIINCDKLTYQRLDFNSLDLKSLKELLIIRNFENKILGDKNILLYYPIDSSVENSSTNYVIRIFKKQTSSPTLNVPALHFLESPISFLLNSTQSDATNYKNSKSIGDGIEVIYSDSNVKIFNYEVITNKLLLKESYNNSKLSIRNEIDKIKFQANDSNASFNFLIDKDSRYYSLGHSSLYLRSFKSK
jgi:hypothetical protein